MGAVTDRYYWKARLVKDGPFIPLTTWFGPPVVDGEELDRSPRWQAAIRDEMTSRAVLMGDEIPIDVHGVSLRNLEKIEGPEYFYLLAHGTWAVQHQPSHPAASPKTAINRRGKSVF